MNLKIKRKVRKMNNVLIGYKQGDNNYVYVSGISKNNISITTNIEDAINFEKEAKGIALFLNKKDDSKEYKVLSVTITISEK